MDEELIGEAGEFVLGTLDQEERRAFLRRMAGEPPAVEAVGMWHGLLAPLALAAPPVEPPGSLWPRIEARLGFAANDNRVSSWWRSGAVAASVAALALALVPLARQPSPVAPPPEAGQPAQPTFIAAVSPADAQPALLVTLDPKTGKAVVRALKLTVPQQRSLELWYIGGGRAPESLGLLEQDMTAEMVLSTAMKNRDSFDASQFAVSVEPVGGAPGGAPTGPIVYTGKLEKLATGT